MDRSRKRRAGRRRMRIRRARALAVLAGMAALSITLLWAIKPRVPDQMASGDFVVESAQPPTAAPTPDPTATPAPTPANTMLPILTRVKTEGKKITLTVDDCYQMDNMWEILALCDEYGARVTFFPNAQAVKRDPDLWREIYARGHGIENHTYHHKNLLNLDEETIYKEIYEMDKLINRTLGIQYTMRAVRTSGGDARADVRVHRIMAELGYEYMAHWSYSGSGNNPYDLLDQLSDGQIILFHASNSDLRKLRVVIPGAVALGYELVTLNDLLGVGPNAVSELSGG